MLLYVIAGLVDENVEYTILDTCFFNKEFTYLLRGGPP